MCPICHSDNVETHILEEKELYDILDCYCHDCGEEFEVSEDHED